MQGVTVLWKNLVITIYEAVFNFIYFASHKLLKLCYKYLQLYSNLLSFCVAFYYSIPDLLLKTFSKKRRSQSRKRNRNNCDCFIISRLNEKICYKLVLFFHNHKEQGFTQQDYVNLTLVTLVPWKKPIKLTALSVPTRDDFPGSQSTILLGCCLYLLTGVLTTGLSAGL